MTSWSRHEEEKAMKTGEGVIEEARPGRRYVVTCDVAVPSRIWMRAGNRALPNALIVIPAIALLALALALVGLAAVSMDRPRVPLDTVTVDTEPVHSVPIYAPRGVDLLNAP
jgi:hypothetical protein